MARLLRPAAKAATRGSSAFRMARPSGGSAWTSSYLARAMPSIPSGKNSRCTAATFETTAQLGSAMRARTAISPAWFIPISMTATSCSGSSRRSWSGTPKWLLRFPADLRTLNLALRTWAIASLVVVLPAEPVTPMTRLPQARRTWRARVCIALRTQSSPSGT